MKLKTKYIVLLVFCMFAEIFTSRSTSFALENKKSSEVVAGNAKQGEQLFSDTCKKCHHEGSKSPLLKGLFKTQKKLGNGKSVTIENVKLQLKNGSKLMPGYKDKYNEEQINNLIAYLKTL